MFVLFKGPVCLKCAGDAASRDHGRRVFALSLPDVLLDTPHGLEQTDTVYTPQGGLTPFGMQLASWEMNRPQPGLSLPSQKESGWLFSTHRPRIHEAWLSLGDSKLPTWKTQIKNRDMSAYAKGLGPQPSYALDHHQ